MNEIPNSGAGAASLIDWRVSATLENVLRGGEEFPEVTSLEQAVRAWMALDEGHRSHARLTIERPIHFEGALVAAFTGGAIEALVPRLPASAIGDDDSDGKSTEGSADPRRL